MDNKRREFFLGTFDHNFRALHKIQNVNSSACVVFHGLAKPMTPCLDEFLFVQTCLFFAPSNTLGNGCHRIDELFVRPCSISVPLNVFQAVVEMNGPRPAIEAEPSPVPKFEGKDIWGSAYLKHHAIRYRNSGAFRQELESGRASLRECGSHIFRLEIQSLSPVRGGDQIPFRAELTPVFSPRYTAASGPASSR